MTLFEPTPYTVEPQPVPSPPPFLEPRRSDPKSGVTLGPTGRIILQDLNVALSSNYSARDQAHNFVDFVERIEEYHVWLTELLEPEYVILITARPDAHRMRTIERIAEVTDWIPDESCFAKVRGMPSTIKHHAMRNRIFPVHGDDPSLYYAIESNVVTRKMYRDLGIPARNAYRGGDPWAALA